MYPQRLSTGTSGGRKLVNATGKPRFAWKTATETELVKKVALCSMSVLKQEITLVCRQSVQPTNNSNTSYQARKGCNYIPSRQQGIIILGVCRMIA